MWLYTHTHTHTNIGPNAQDAELVPQPGFKPASPEAEAQSPNHWTTREVPIITIVIFCSPIKPAAMT